MANTAHESRSSDEHEFWDRRFDEPAGPLPGEPITEPVVAAPVTTAPVTATPVEPGIGRGADRRARLAAARNDAGADGGPDPSDRRPPLVGAPAERAIPRPPAPEPTTSLERAFEWLRDRRGDPRIGVVVLVMVAVVAGFVWYRVGLSGGGEPPPSVRARSSAAGAPSTAAGGGDAAPAPSATRRSSDADDPDRAPATVVVHVAGAVAHPGVVELAGSSRVIDALEAVGGATPDADVDRLNLAAPAVDGSRVYVPRRGEADPGVTGGGTAAEAGPAGSGTPGARIDLNTATQAQLEALPGIGPTYAQAIIAERTRRGGFRSVNELREVRGIGEKRFADLAPLVTT